MLWIPNFAPLFMFPGCCGCDEYCPYCTGATPEQFEVTLAGITNGSGCTLCNGFNGTHAMSKADPFANPNCHWDTLNLIGTSGACPGRTLRLALGFLAYNLPGGGLSTADYYARVLGSGLGQWVLPLADFDCLGTNVLPLVYTDPIARCITLPATVTVEPV